MKKIFLIILFIGSLIFAPAEKIEAAHIDGEQESATEPEEDIDASVSDQDSESDSEENPAPTINPDNYVNVEMIDLSLHFERTGTFTPVYSYENPFLGKDTSQGVILEFYAKPTWEVHVLGTIFSFIGSGDYDGRLYFTPGSYLGFNSASFGGFFDANLFNYSIVDDYIKDGAKIRIELTPSGFAVYSNDTFCYDQTILDDEFRGSGDYTSDSDFSQVLKWLSGADTLSFGYGSWWNTASSDEANINLSQVNFRLMDGTVVMDQLQADKVLVESLGGSVEALVDNNNDSSLLEDTEVEVFDINSVHYDGVSVVPYVIAIVSVVAVLAIVVVLISIRKRTYEDY